MKEPKRGFFITFEGIDGSGKTTAAHALATYLLNHGYPVTLTKEPGASQLGKELRELIGNHHTALDPIATFLLFAADRAQHMQQLVIPALARGEIVISDRSADSSIVYQGYAQGVDITMIQMINRWVMNHIEPDLTVYLHIDAVVACERRKQRGKQESFDTQPAAFFEKLIHGYGELFKKRKNVLFLDGTKPIYQINAELVQSIAPILQSYAKVTA
ncbi:MAG: dTMP kinase [Candidatus Babeliales bacterium]